MKMFDERNSGIKSKAVKYTGSAILFGSIAIASSFAVASKDSPSKDYCPPYCEIEEVQSMSAEDSGPAS